MTLSQKQDKINNQLFGLLTKVTDLEQQFQKKGKNTVVLFVDLQGPIHYKITHTFFESLRKIMTRNSVVSDIVKKSWDHNKMTRCWNYGKIFRKKYHCLNKGFC